MGRHLRPGSIVHTTAEIVLMEAVDLRFERRRDVATGYPELEIAPARK